jgi:hypothetical protein
MASTKPGGASVDDSDVRVAAKPSASITVRSTIGFNTGAPWRWDQMWRNSEDSRKLNTSYVERLNLTIRQGSAFLFRRTICHARQKQRLADHLELLRCYYNFVRPHRALEFGREVRTPAMQAGLVKRRLSFRDIFSESPLFWLFAEIHFVFNYRPRDCVQRCLVAENSALVLSLLRTNENPSGARKGFSGTPESSRPRIRSRGGNPRGRRNLSSLRTPSSVKPILAPRLENCRFRFMQPNSDALSVLGCAK